MGFVKHSSGDLFVRQLARRSPSRYVGYALIVTIVYVAIVCVVYMASAILLTKGIVLPYSPLRSYQRNFYYSSYMNVWQTHLDCVDFDDVLIYKPRIGQCRFANPEFDTTLTFGEDGRKAPEGAFRAGGIAVLGDSHAMGWGVEDSETFSSILQQDLGRRVYNLAVASYGTRRELLRLEASNLLDKIDTIVVLYCDNDLSENLSFQPLDKAVARQTFDSMFSMHHGSLVKMRSVLEGFARSIADPLLTLKRSFDARLDFEPHYEQIIKVLSEFPVLSTKRVIVAYSNSYGRKFANFSAGFSPKLQNVFFADLAVPEEEYFTIDGHLSKSGHSTIAKQLKVLVSGRP